MLCRPPGRGGERPPQGMIGFVGVLPVLVARPLDAFGHHVHCPVERDRLPLGRVRASVEHLVDAVRPGDELEGGCLRFNVRIAERDLDQLQEVAGTRLDRATHSESRIRKLDRPADTVDARDSGRNRRVLRNTIGCPLHGCRATGAGRKPLGR